MIETTHLSCNQYSPYLDHQTLITPARAMAMYSSSRSRWDQFSEDSGKESLPHSDSDSDMNINPEETGTSKTDRRKALFSCDLCEVECSSIDALQKHFAGTKHQKKLGLNGLSSNLKAKYEIRESDELSGKIVACTLCKVVFHGLERAIHFKSEKHRALSNFANESVKVEHSQFLEVIADAPADCMELEIDIDAPEKVKDGYRCTLCDATLTTPTLFQAHIEGKKHQKKARWHYLCKEGDSLEVNQYWCRLCNTFCTDRDALTAHYRGKNHIKILQKKGWIKDDEDENGKPTDLRGKVRIKEEPMSDSDESEYRLDLSKVKKEPSLKFHSSERSKKRSYRISRSETPPSSESDHSRSPSPPPVRKKKNRSRSSSARKRRNSSRSPPARKRKSHTPSPPPRVRKRKDRSPSPPIVRKRKDSSPSARIVRKRKDSSPPHKRKNRSPSPPPPRKRKARSPSPPPKRKVSIPSAYKKKDDSRSPSSSPVRRRKSSSGHRMSSPVHKKKYHSPSPVFSSSPSPSPVRRRKSSSGGRKKKNPSPSPVRRRKSHKEASRSPSESSSRSRSNSRTRHSKQTQQSNRDSRKRKRSERGQSKTPPPQKRAKTNRSSSRERWRSKTPPTRRSSASTSKRGRSARDSSSSQSRSRNRWHSTDNQSDTTQESQCTVTSSRSTSTRGRGRFGRGSFLFTEHDDRNVRQYSSRSRSPSPPREKRRRRSSSAGMWKRGGWRHERSRYFSGFKDRRNSGQRYARIEPEPVSSGEEHHEELHFEGFSQDMSSDDSSVPPISSLSVSYILYALKKSCKKD